MRSEYMKTIVGRRSQTHRTRAEARKFIRQRCDANQDEARKTMAAVSGGNGNRRTRVCSQLAEIGQRRADQAAGLRRSLDDGRRQRHDSVAARLEELRQESHLCRGYWSLSGGEDV